MELPYVGLIIELYIEPVPVEYCLNWTVLFTAVNSHSKGSHSSIYLLNWHCCHIIQIVDGEESNTENIGRRNSCIGRGVAESNTAFLSPIFSVLDDSTSTNCYILIPLHTRWSKLWLTALAGFPPFWNQKLTAPLWLHKGFWVQISLTRHD